MGGGAGRGQFFSSPSAGPVAAKTSFVTASARGALVAVAVSVSLTFYPVAHHSINGHCNSPRTIGLRTYDASLAQLPRSRRCFVPLLHRIAKVPLSFSIAGLPPRTPRLAPSPPTCPANCSPSLPPRRRPLRRAAPRLAHPVLACLRPSFPPPPSIH